jgi:hypothetical protein
MTLNMNKGPTKLWITFATLAIPAKPLAPIRHEHVFAEQQRKARQRERDKTDGHRPVRYAFCAIEAFDHSPRRFAV